MYKTLYAVNGQIMWVVGDTARKIIDPEQLVELRRQRGATYQHKGANALLIVGQMRFALHHSVVKIMREYDRPRRYQAA